MKSGGDRSQEGRAGEEIAAKYLRKRGFQILRRNWRGRSGEIDLIARDGDTLVFVEVKAGASDRWGGPEEAVTPLKQRKLIMAAQEFVCRGRISDRPMRFDVIAVLTGDGEPQVRHLPDAFQPGGRL
jgi:putative endonuclease